MPSRNTSNTPLPLNGAGAGLPGNQQIAMFRALIRQRFTPFFEWAGRALVGRDVFVMNWHLRTMAHHLDRVAEGQIKRLIITLPPRSLKSLMASVAFPAWLLGRDPSKRILCVSYSGGLAVDHAENFRRLVGIQDFKNTFADLDLHKGRNTQLEQRTSQGGFRLATSVGGTITGRGGDVIIIDDPIRAGGIMSEVERKNVNAWYGNTLISRLDNPEESAIIIVMQCLHEDDLVGHLLQEPDHGWTVLNIPAIAEQEMSYALSYRPNDVFVRPVGSLIDERRAGPDSLQTARNELGEPDFNAQYQQNPTPFGGNIIKRDHLHRYDDESLQAAKQNRHMVLQSWDTTQKTGEANDYSACTTYLVTETGILLWDVHRERLEADELLATAKRLAQKFGANQIVVEDVQGGTGLIQQLRKQISAKVIAKVPQEDKEARLRSVQFMVRQGALLLPQDTEWLEAFERELLGFPSARHDDQVDSLTQALNYLSQKTIGVARYDKEGRAVRSQPKRRSGSRPARTGEPRNEAPTKYGHLTAEHRSKHSVYP